MVSKVTFLLDLDLSEVPREKRAEAKAEVADFLKEQILSDCDEGVSSVSGRAWKGLSAEYKHRKAGESSHPVANLELSGDLLDALDTKVKPSGVEVGWFDRAEVPKADGHNNHSGDSSLPLRQSIPKEGQAFRPGIMKEVEKILSEYRGLGDGD